MVPVSPGFNVAEEIDVSAHEHEVRILPKITSRASVLDTVNSTVCAVFAGNAPKL